MSTGAVDIAGVEKHFGDFVAVRHLDLQIEGGEFFSIIGPSGCGKTTTLRMVAGFEHPTAGTISVAGKDMTDVRPIVRVTHLFAASAECGALAASASPFVVKALRDFGTAYGIAFQMRDDLLDITADEAALGKPVGNDLRERKMTVPLVLALEAGDREFRAAVERFFAEDDVGPERIAQIVAGIGGHGGLSRTEAVLAGYVERAKHSLAPLGNVPARAELASLADALL